MGHLLHSLRPLIALDLLIPALAVLGAPAPVGARSAAFLRDCRDGIGRKGYSTEDIEQRTGKRRPGMAWRPSVAR